MRNFFERKLTTTKTMAAPKKSGAQVGKLGAENPFLKRDTMTKNTMVAKKSEVVKKEAVQKNAKDLNNSFGSDKEDDKKKSPEKEKPNNNLNKMQSKTSGSTGFTASFQPKTFTPTVNPPKEEAVTQKKEGVTEKKEDKGEDKAGMEFGGEEKKVEEKPVKKGFMTSHDPDKFKASDRPFGQQRESARTMAAGASAP